MAKSLLYAANANGQTLGIGGVINFGNVVRRYGRNCDLSGGNAEVSGSGYYSVATNFTYVASASGTGTIALYKDGVAIPGATISGTVAANSTYSLSIPAIVKQCCDCCSTITAVLSGVAGEFTNAAITVEKT